MSDGAHGSHGAARSALAARYPAVRAATERLCAKLSVEDCQVQSMPDASPVKWHLAHTTWFFETFVLEAHVRGYRRYHDGWGYLFNSYYDALGPRHPRPARGLLTRPSLCEVYGYRTAVDQAMSALLEHEPGLAPELRGLIELGLNHEQQHQELILTDVQHALGCNPLQPAYDASRAPARAAANGELRWLPNDGGVFTAGHGGGSFAFDNETPVHRVLLEPFAIASRLVTAGEYAEFIADNGYSRPSLWLSEGYDLARAQGWTAPLYWERRDGVWCRFSLAGPIEVDPQAPVCHVSYYEADAFARWAGLRLPTEAEWEVVARELPIDGQFVEDGALVPLARPLQRGLCGGAWTWTQSAYAAYPGFTPARGAVSEYNAKFMVNQLVLRGGSCFTPRDHVRCTYRNFFPPHARWQVTGIRLAR